MKAWNARNELQAVTPVVRDGDRDDRESYRYGAQSQRVLKVSVQKTGSGVQTRRVVYLPGLELRSTHRGDAETERLQVMTAGEAGRAQVRVLHWTSGRPDGISNDQVRYSHDNLTGSSGLEVDGDGRVISMEEYYPYGGTAILTARSAAEADYRTVRYSGKERDATGLYYYGYRYCQPWSGRWLSADPAGTVDGLNLFRMCRNNPVTLKDESGLAPIHGGAAFPEPHTNNNAEAHTRGWLSRLFIRRRRSPSQETNSSVIGVGSIGIVRTFKDGWLIKEFSGYFDMENKTRLHSAINNAKGFNLFYAPGSAFVRIEGMDGTEAKKVRNIMRAVPGISLNKLTDMPAVMAAVSVIDQENPAVYLSEKLSRLGITHNDINLGNIMYDEISNEFNLVDFDSASFSTDKEGNVKSLTVLQKESMKKKLDYVFNDFKRKVRQMQMLSKQ
ncbi:hypothetical protein ABR39_00775 [Enterobacter genomosp. O]|nr:hypothetical protein ABR39_00775 [Enterobacter genomosp. O]